MVPLSYEVLTKRHSETTNQKKVKLETKHDIKHMEPKIIISERKIGGQKQHLVTQFIKINPSRKFC